MDPHGTSWVTGQVTSSLTRSRPDPMCGFRPPKPAHFEGLSKVTFTPAQAGARNPAKEIRAEKSPLNRLSSEGNSLNHGLIVSTISNRSAHRRHCLDDGEQRGAVQIDCLHHPQPGQWLVRTAAASYHRRAIALRPPLGERSSRTASTNPRNEPSVRVRARSTPGHPCHPCPECAAGPP